MFAKQNPKENNANSMYTFWNSIPDIELFADCEKYSDYDHNYDLPVSGIRNPFVDSCSPSEGVSSFSNTIIDELEIQLPKNPFGDVSQDFGNVFLNYEMFKADDFLCREDCAPTFGEKYNNLSIHCDSEHPEEVPENLVEQDAEIEETNEKAGSARSESSECKSESMGYSTTPKTTTKMSEDSLSNSSASSPKKVQKPAASKKLSLRADVMNKNLFRALRRECKNIFEEYLKDHNLSLSKARRTFFVNLKKFTQHLLDTTQVDWRTMPNFNSSEFAEYLGIFLNSCLMKKGNEEQEEVTYKHTQVS